MDKTRFLPPDPVEAAQVPVDDVDLPDDDMAGQGQAFPENEGLKTGDPPAPGPAPGDVDPTTGPGPEETAQAAQRGRTA